MQTPGFEMITTLPGWGGGRCEESASPSPKKLPGWELVVHLSEMFHLRHLPNCTDLQSVSSEAKQLIVLKCFLRLWKTDLSLMVHKPHLCFY